MFFMVYGYVNRFGEELLVWVVFLYVVTSWGHRLSVERRVRGQLVPFLNGALSEQWIS